LLKSATVTIGHTAVLKCKVKADPKPSIRWWGFIILYRTILIFRSKNGVEIQASDRVVLQHLDDGTLTLTVHNAQFEDTNEYRCEVSFIESNK
jgi:hypothetical protein